MIHKNLVGKKGCIDDNMYEFHQRTNSDYFTYLVKDRK